MNVSLKPDVTLESAAHVRISKQIRFIDTDLHLYIIAKNLYLIQIFFSSEIFHLTLGLDLSHDLIMITFHTKWHKESIYNGKYIFCLNSS